MKDHTKILMAIVLMTLFLSVCEEGKQEIITSQGEITIIGYNELTTTMTISPGTTVKFQSYEPSGGPIGCHGLGKPGELKITGGGKLIAQGTKDNPIIFEGIGNLIFDDTASNESVLEYCQLKDQVHISISNSIVVKYSKFETGPVSEGYQFYIGNNSRPQIQYNNLEDYFLIIEGNSEPSINYNYFNKGGIIISSNTLVTMENNNIIFTAGEAIYYNSETSSLTVTSNYIANCNGKTNVDITGEQSRNVVYIDPQSNPINSAGCGW